MTEPTPLFPSQGQPPLSAWVSFSGEYGSVKMILGPTREDLNDVDEGDVAFIKRTHSDGRDIPLFIREADPKTGVVKGHVMKEVEESCLTMFDESGKMLPRVASRKCVGVWREHKVSGIRMIVRTNG